MDKLTARISRLLSPSSKTERKPRNAADVEKYDPPAGAPPSHHVADFAPPSHPPPNCPSLVSYTSESIVFPSLTPSQIPMLYGQGYARLADPPASLLTAATDLFDTSRDFFAQPPANKIQFSLAELLTAKEKQASRAGQGAEEGYSRVVGEKEMLTVRRARWPDVEDAAGKTAGRTACPPHVRPAAETLWRECGSYMTSLMRAIEASLLLEGKPFDPLFIDECTLPENIRHETLLRMFRYEREPLASSDTVTSTTSADPHSKDATSPASKGKLVSEHHKDIGLLSLVIGSSPGLEVWDDRPGQKKWVTIEEDEIDVANGQRFRQGEDRLTLTVLVGQTLSVLTKGFYKPGVHRVFVPPPPSSASVSPTASDAITPTTTMEDQSKYRYSLVYALRPHKTATILTDTLSSPLSSHISWPPKLNGVKGQVLFDEIANRHWSVNEGKEEREKRKLKLQEKGTLAGDGKERK